MAEPVTYRMKSFFDTYVGLRPEIEVRPAGEVDLIVNEACAALGQTLAREILLGNPEAREALDCADVQIEVVVRITPREKEI